MPKAKVLVVDDSAVVRQMVIDWIGAEPDLTVAATASNGRQALEKFEAYAPDVVVLDIEMPMMTGLETLPELRRRDKSVPIIMFSTLTSHGGRATLEALAAGATDYVLKPSSVGETRIGTQDARRELITKLRALTQARDAKRQPSATRPPVPTLHEEPFTRTRIDAVVIGSSTGGPNVLDAIFRELPADFPVPILVVQHMPPYFTKILAERLSRVSTLRVEEGVAGRPPQPGEAWIAPGGFHMALAREGANIVLAINEDAPENACRPAVDVLFRSAANVYGEHLLGVVLTGMGQDGLRGSEDIRQRRGRVIVQDEESSVVWAMPGHVARAGLASRVLPPVELAHEITRRAFATRFAASGPRP